MEKIGAAELTFTLPASVRLQAFEKMLADYRDKLIANPLDEGAAFGVRVVQKVIDALRDEVNNEWPDVIDE